MHLPKLLNYSLRTRTVNCFTQARQIHESMAVRTDNKAEIEMSGHQPDKWDKRMLVYMKKYPSIDAVPNKVARSTMDRTRQQIRIRINILSCILTGVISYIVYQYGKKQTLQGDNMFVRREKEHEAAKSS